MFFRSAVEFLVNIFISLVFSKFRIMAKSNFRSFFYSIVLPSILAIILFVISIYAIIIPVFERNMLDRKKEMIAELTNIAWSLLEEYNAEYNDSLLRLSEAKSIAAAKIKEIRYGKEKKDYFWITDMQPQMIMHPYKKELVGKNLNDYADPEGKKLFVEAVNIVKEKGEGYVDYLWQWKDDSTRIVPKLSYVKGFDEWGWIVGTGIYLEDVNQEIKALEKKLIRVSLAITAVISIFLLFIVRQSLRIERRRKNAESSLKASKQKYQSLVEASVDGTLMLQNHKIVFSNQKLNRMLGITAMEISNLSFNDIFELQWDTAYQKITTPDKSFTFETKLKQAVPEQKEVVVTISKVDYGRSESFIVIVKDLSQQSKLKSDTLHLSEEIQTSILLMNQPIKNYIQEYIKCELNITVEDAALLMSKNNKSAIFIAQQGKIIGVITDSDLRKRILAEKAGANTLVSEVMTAPVVSITQNALLFEAQVKFNKEEISCLLIKDERGVNVGMITKQEFLNIQHNFLLLLIKEIEIAECKTELQKIYKRLPSLIHALLESGGTIKNITRIITSVSDAITKRVIELAIEKIGFPPCKFAFISMGSEGRKEQSLSTDQDNAIIYEDGLTDMAKIAAEYFANLAQMINMELNFIGYKYCNGEVMANNPKWNQPLNVWESYFKNWVTNSDPHGLLEAAIFFDFRHIFGEENYSQKLRNYINEVSENKAVFFQHLAQPIIKYKTPVNIFGQIIGKEVSGDSEFIDVKKNIITNNWFYQVLCIEK